MGGGRESKKVAGKGLVGRRGPPLQNSLIKAKPYINQRPSAGEEGGFRKTEGESVYREHRGRSAWEGDKKDPLDQQGY